MEGSAVYSLMALYGIRCVDGKGGGKTNSWVKDTDSPHQVTRPRRHQNNSWLMVPIGALHKKADQLCLLYGYLISIVNS